MWKETCNLFPGCLIYCLLLFPLPIQSGLMMINIFSRLYHIALYTLWLLCNAYFVLFRCTPPFLSSVLCEERQGSEAHTPDWRDQKNWRAVLSSHYRRLRVRVNVNNLQVIKNSPLKNIPSFVPIPVVIVMMMGEVVPIQAK